MEPNIVNHPEQELTSKTIQELDSMHKCLVRSPFTRNSLLTREVEQAIEIKVEQTRM